MPAPLSWPWLLAATPGCDVFCVTARCDELNGDVQWECGGCAGTAVCQPGAPGFPGAALVTVDARGGTLQPTTASRPSGAISAQVKESKSYRPRVRKSDGMMVLFHAHSDGLIQVEIDCTKRGSHCGHMNELYSGNRWRRKIFREEAAGGASWAACDDTSSECTELDASLAARLSASCLPPEPEALNADWLDGCEEDGEPVADFDCRASRHRSVYGEHFLPVGADELHGREHDSAEPAADRPQFSELRHSTLLPIAEVQGCLGFAEFAKRHVYRHRPVVMRGCASSMPATTRWRSDDYLIRAAGGWRGQESFPSANHTLAEWLRATSRGERKEYLPWKPLPAALRRDLTLPTTLACAELLDNIRAFWHDMHIRMTDGHGNLNGLHFDGGDFFSIQMDGVKTWTMVDPVDSLYLYADHVYPPPGPSYGHQVFRRAGINVTHLPRIVSTPAYRADVRPTDLLYIPQRWWHEIHTHRGRNIGVVLQTNFPSPPSFHEQFVEHEWGPTFFSRNLLEFGLSWRHLGAEGMPYSVRQCSSRNAQGESVDSLWERGLDYTTRRDKMDNSR